MLSQAREYNCQSVHEIPPGQLDGGSQHILLLRSGSSIKLIATYAEFGPFVQNRKYRITVEEILE